LADQSVRYPLGIAKNILRASRLFGAGHAFRLKMSLILRKPFLSTANAHINVEKGSIKFTINGQKHQFTFKSKQEIHSSPKMIDQDKIEEPLESLTLGLSPE